jgi:superfamily II DNA/RNA helicase
LHPFIIKDYTFPEDKAAIVASTSRLILKVYLHDVIVFSFLRFNLSKLPHILIIQIVVFFSTCDAVDFHYYLLSAFKFSVYSQPDEELRQMFVRCKTFRLHGNMKQEDRRTTFQAFKTEKLSLLLSTDIAARGLDFPEVRFIIQYDSPGEATEYVHRYQRLPEFFVSRFFYLLLFELFAALVFFSLGDC